jgi:hypothetical protein
MGKNGNIWKQYGKQLRKYGKRLDNCDLMKGKHVVFVCYCKSTLEENCDFMGEDGCTMGM